MSSLEIVVAIVIVNTLISFVYLLFAYKRKAAQNVINGFIILLSPPIGALFIFGAFIALKIREKTRVMQIDDIGFSKGRHNRLLAPDYEEEIQSVPLEEMFLISQNEDKRRHLLRTLKKDNVDSYKTLLLALENEDAETAHYAASAISSAKAMFENDIRELDSLYSRESLKKDTELLREYANHVLKFILSGILRDAEMRKYSYLYAKLVGDMEMEGMELTEGDYAAVVNELIRLDEYGSAEAWAEKAFNMIPGENSYLLLIKVFYRTNQTEKLYDTIAKLKKSDIPLSAEGLEVIRFFRNPIVRQN